MSARLYSDQTGKRRGNRKALRVGIFKLCKKMKKYFVFFCYVVIATITFNLCSCSKVEDENQTVQEIAEITPLGEMLSAIVEDNNLANSIVYLTCGKDGSYVISFKDMADGDDETADTRSANDNWHYAGYVKGKISALKLAKKLSYKLENDKVVLIKIVPYKDGWNVYWKYDD